MWGLVRTGWPDFNVVLVSLRLNAGNYCREKAIRPCWAAQRGGRTHAQQGGESCHRRDQSSVKQSPDPRPQFSGKRLGRWFRAPQLSRISRDTILWTERGNTARRQPQCKRARTQTHALTQSLLLSFSLTHKKKKQLGGGLQQPYYHSNSISHIWAQIKTLWICIFPVNRSSLIERLRSKEWFLFPEHVKMKVVGTSDEYHVTWRKWNIINAVCKCSKYI